MKRQTWIRRTAALVAAGPLAAALAGAADTSGELHYTRYNRPPGEANVRSIGYAYANGQLTLGARTDIADTAGADGLVFAPDGDLLVGGQGDAVYKIEPRENGRVVARGAGGGGAYHVAIDPSGERAWVGGNQPGELVEVGLKPFRDGVVRPLQGDDLAITHVVFDEAGNSFYTASMPTGVGSFGVIDLATFTTTRLMSGLPAAHGSTFDPYTGHLFLYGEKHITQVDPVSLTVVSDLDLTLHPALNLPFKNEIDQGSTDGLGHAFAAVNNGHLVFVDYAMTGLVGDSGNVVEAPMLDSFLDDIAPLVGPGARPPGPRPRGEEKVTGGGTTEVAGGIANFGFNARKRGGQVSGSLTWNDHATGDKVRSVSVDTLVVEGDQATFAGTCTNNDTPCTFTAVAVDRGEPGRDDVFQLSISGGPLAGGATVRSGNVQIH